MLFLLIYFISNVLIAYLMAKVIEAYHIVETLSGGVDEEGPYEKGFPFNSLKSIVVSILLGWILIVVVSIYFVCIILPRGEGGAVTFHWGWPWENPYSKIRTLFLDDKLYVIFGKYAWEQNGSMITVKELSEHLWYNSWGFKTTPEWIKETSTPINCWEDMPDVIIELHSMPAYMVKNIQHLKSYI